MPMSRSLLLFAAFATLALGTTIQTPRNGAVRYADATVYPLLGVSRAFVVGQPLLNHASATAFCDRAGIVAVEGGLAIVDVSGTILSRWDGDSQGSILSIQDAPLQAIAWLPSSNTIVTYAEGSWRGIAVSSPLPGTVLAIRRASKDTAHLLLSEGQPVFEMTVGLASGNALLQRLLAEVKAPVTYLGDGWLYQDDDSLVFESTAAGKRSTVQFSGTAASLEQMADDALHLTESSTGAHWMLEITPKGGLALSQLPVPAVTMAGGLR